ncbi:LamG-like jellyroll fold domain-containing protein [Planctomycetota bacterium]
MRCSKNRNSICLFCAFLLLGGVVGVGHAALIGHWPFDEGSGDTAFDESGHGSDGTLSKESLWAPTAGVGGAINFSGSGDGRVNLPQIDLGTNFTVMGWVKPDRDDQNFACILTSDYALGFYLGSRGVSGEWMFIVANNFGLYGGTVAAKQWQHVAGVFEGGSASLYVNGQLVGGPLNVGPPANPNRAITIGRGGTQGDTMLGQIDDVRIYNEALDEAGLALAMIRHQKELAGYPQPEDGADDILRDVTLEWTPGEYAGTHNVYFGEVWEDVNAAGTGSPLLVSSGKTETFYAAGVLDFEKTYYWRVDEVNGVSVYRGDVWSFEVEPYAIPVTDLSATASGATSGMEASKTIDGSGLDEQDRHSTVGTEMWLTTTTDSWIEYQFDREHKLHQMRVWNSNWKSESKYGFGVKEAVIETSLDGESWTRLEDLTEFAQAPGLDTYQANTTVDFGNSLVKYVKIYPQSAYGATGQSGFSEVRFLVIPNVARDPQPSMNTVSNPADRAEVTLRWRAGREAVSHELYFGSDANDLSLIATPPVPAHTMTLDYNTPYVWSVTEVNEAETPAAYVGPLWNFTTPAYGIIDDFEKYTSAPSFEIWASWSDGWGIPDNGSLVGYGDVGETTIVYGGNQSMPFRYDNWSSSVPRSEATLQIDNEDWLAGNAKILSLYFYGTAGNTGQLYLKINETRIDYPGAADDLSKEEWQPWLIDLPSVSGTLQNVTSLTIGADGNSSSGLLYIDDIMISP